MASTIGIQPAPVLKPALSENFTLVSIFSRVLLSTRATAAAHISPLCLCGFSTRRPVWNESPRVFSCIGPYFPPSLITWNKKSRWSFCRSTSRTWTVRSRRCVCGAGPSSLSLTPKWMHAPDLGAFADAEDCWRTGRAGAQTHIKPARSLWGADGCTPHPAAAPQLWAGSGPMPEEPGAKADDRWLTRSDH